MIDHRVYLRLILLVVLLVEQRLCDQNCYAMGFTAGLEDCKDFTNDYFKGDGMELGKASGDGGESMFLTGCMVFKKPVEEGTFMDIEISKETEVGCEPMWSCSMDVCKSLDDKDAPWSEAMKSMNMTACPIDAGEYCCKEFQLDLSFANDFLNHNYAGLYTANLKLSDTQKNGLSCHELGLSIYEQEEDCE